LFRCALKLCALLVDVATEILRNSLASPVGSPRQLRDVPAGPAAHQIRPREGPATRAAHEVCLEEFIADAAARRIRPALAEVIQSTRVYCDTFIRPLRCFPANAHEVSSAG